MTTLRNSSSLPGARPVRQFKAGLYDYVTKQRIETVNLTTKENQKMSEACKEWMKAGYGSPVYVESYDHPTKAGYIVKMIFSEQSDFFLMFSCQKNTCPVS